MSLIERAVTRLGGNPPVFPQPEEPGVGETGAVASEPKLSSIERLMEREPDRVTVPTARPAEKPAADTGSTAAPAPAAPGS